MSIANTGIAQWIASVCSSFHIVSSSRTILAYRFCFFSIVSTLPSHRTPLALSINSIFGPKMYDERVCVCACHGRCSCMCQQPIFVFNFIQTTQICCVFELNENGDKSIRPKSAKEEEEVEKRRKNETMQKWRNTKNNNLNPLSYVLCIYWSGDGVDRCLCICSLLLLRQ